MKTFYSNSVVETNIYCYECGEHDKIRWQVLTCENVTDYMIHHRNRYIKIAGIFKGFKGIQACLN